MSCLVIFIPDLRGKCFINKINKNNSDDKCISLCVIFTLWEYTCWIWRLSWSLCSMRHNEYGIQVFSTSILDVKQVRCCPLCLPQECGDPILGVKNPRQSDLLPVGALISEINLFTIWFTYYPKCIWIYWKIVNTVMIPVIKWPPYCSYL